MAAHDLEVSCAIEPNKITFHLRANAEVVKYMVGIGAVSIGAKKKGRQPYSTRVIVFAD